jgi:hypothetical protein
MVLSYLDYFSDLSFRELALPCQLLAKVSRGASYHIRGVAHRVKRYPVRVGRVAVYLLE